jgi:hypothetical protein
MSAASDRKPHQIHFTLDGRHLSIETARQSAAEILRLGGLDPAGYDLKQIRPGHHEPVPYADDDEVHITDGEKFVSVRQKATVA